MPFRDFLHKDSICIDVTSRSKTAVLLTLSQLLSKNYPPLETEPLFDAYWKREAMGSTTIGHGIMIPHIRTISANKTCGCLLKLRNPVDFGAEDKQPVDLVLGLVVPEHQINEHLQVLAKITKQFNSPKFRTACHNATDQATLFALLVQNSLERIHLHTEMAE